MLETAEKWISKLQDWSEEAIQNAHRKKEMKNRKYVVKRHGG